MKATAIFLAGINNSGPGHWQRLWHEGLPGSLWVEHADWDWPGAKTWIADLERQLPEAPTPRVAVAHSLGCLLLGQWMAGRGAETGIHAALLVAPPDVEAPDFPEGLGFAPGRSQSPLKIPSLVVASQDDPYGGLEHARRCALAWNAAFVDVGAKGHINAASKLGDWREGWGHLQNLLRTSGLEL